jgi:hypothetical protein
LSDARSELNGPPLLRWRPFLLRWLGASEKTGWDWIGLSLKLAILLTIALGGWYFSSINNTLLNDELTFDFLFEFQMKAFYKNISRWVNLFILDIDLKQGCIKSGQIFD